VSSHGTISSTTSGHPGFEYVTCCEYASRDAAFGTALKQVIDVHVRYGVSDRRGEVILHIT
jgi:hypothetical protein